MATTPEQRDQHPLCGAKRKSGGTCRKYAGEGTQHFGSGKCKFHGGNSPNHNKRAIRLDAKRKMVTQTLGAPIENITAIDAILSELWAATGHTAWLRQQIADMGEDELATPYGIVILGMYDSERDRRVAIASLAIKAGVDEAAIRIAEVQVSLLGNALSKACDTAGVSASMRLRIGEALREELQGIDARPLALNTAA
jgi:hypothetical protein